MERPKGASGIPLETAVLLLPTPTAQLNAPAPWKEGVDWWLQSRATRNLEGVVTGNTPLLGTPNARDYKGYSGWDGQKSLATDVERTLLKTPTAQLAVNGGSQHPDKRTAGGHGPTLADQVEFTLLPTPSAGVFNDGEDLGSWRQRKERNLAKGINGNGQGTPLAIAVKDEVHWGKFGPAIFSWEKCLARKAPPPTEPTGKNGNPRLSPRFVEWMMGLPEGWVTGVPGLTRKEQLKALGNGCVPAQAEMALRLLLERMPDG